MADYYGHLLRHRFRAGGKVAVQPLKWVQGSVFAEIATTETVQLGGVGLGVAPGTNMLNIVPSQTTYKGIQVKGASGQSAALLDLRDNADNKILEVLDDAFGVFEATPVAQQADLGAITDNSGGSANTTIEAFAGDFAGIYVTGNSNTTGIGTPGTFVQFTEFTTDGPESVSDADYTNDHIVIGATGTYLVFGSFSYNCDLNDVVRIQVEKNNGATSLSQLTIEDLMSSSSDYETGAFIFPVDLTLNDTLEIWVTNDTDTNAVLIKNAMFGVLRIDDNASLANNFADIASRMNSIRTYLRNFGFMA